jgi:hypothetical protein
MIVKHVRFESALAERLAAVRAAVQAQHPGQIVSDASLIRESVETALRDGRFLRRLGLSARGIAAVTRRE